MNSSHQFYSQNNPKNQLLLFKVFQRTPQNPKSPNLKNKKSSTLTSTKKLNLILTLSLPILFQMNLQWNTKRLIKISIRSLKIQVKVLKLMDGGKMKYWISLMSPCIKMKRSNTKLQNLKVRTPSKNFLLKRRAKFLNRS